MSESILPRSGIKLQEKRKERAIHFLMVIFQLKSRRQLISIGIWVLVVLWVVFFF